MEVAKITAQLDGNLGVNVEAKGSNLILGLLLTDIIRCVLKRNDDVALAAIITAVDSSDKKRMLYTMLERYINSQKGKSL